MPEYLIDSLDDPRLDCYRDLRHGGSRADDVFIAEGDKLVRRLLASRCQTESILCTSEARIELADQIPPGVAVFIAETRIIAQVIGFKFHRGVLAAGRPPAERGLDDVLTSSVQPSGNSLIAMCPETRDPANLGTIIRTAAAFGAICVVVGRDGTAPYSRRTLRTSMGAVLNTPIVPIDDWQEAIGLLHAYDFETFAAVLDESAEPLLQIVPQARSAVLFGNEDRGLPAELVCLCRRRVCIPMANSDISLNVAVAAGVLLHHFGSGSTRRCIVRPGRSDY
jgi:tRNA G18 (ribose-2'-O)-methylase SpoU